jgi:hypothetical protein
MMRGTVARTLNVLLDAQAGLLRLARRYQHTAAHPRYRRETENVGEVVGGVTECSKTLDRYFAP